MKKIAYITEATAIGGGETNLIRLAEQMQRFNVVEIFCPDGKLFTAASDVCKTNKIHFSPKKRWIKRWPIMLPLDGKKLNSLNDFDIIHAYSVNVLPLLKSIRSKKVWTNHGYWELSNGTRGPSIENMVDGIITVSKEVDAHCQIDNIPREMIYLGAVKETDIKASPIVTKLDNITLLCIGRFQRIKGQDLLVSAIEKLCKTIKSNIIVNFLGAPDPNKDNQNFYHEVQKEATRIESQNANVEFIFHGFKKDTLSYLRQATAVVIPSLYESFSMVTVEALAAARPVIAPNIGGPAEILNTSSLGVKFKPGDSSSLYNAILFALEHIHCFSADEMNARARAFTIEKQAALVNKFYNELFF